MTEQAQGRSLSGRTAIVTGAASGIGVATVRRLARLGATVYCLDLDRAGVDAVAASLRSEGWSTFGKAVDVADVDAMASLSADVMEETGSLDIAVANAGIEGPGTAVSTPPELWDRVLRTNLTGVWSTVRGALPHMLDRSSGSIVVTASLAGLVGVPNIAAYAASKGGVIALVRQIAADYSSRGIRVNAVCPGTVPTPLVHRSYAQAGGVGAGANVEERLASAAAAYPLGRIGTADEIAAAICFLAGPDSRWTTGVILPIDGGASAM